jgi:hypothetical protein
MPRFKSIGFMSAEHGGGRRAVTGLIGGLRCDLAHHLGAHILELVLELGRIGLSQSLAGGAPAGGKKSRRSGDIPFKIFAKKI